MKNFAIRSLGIAVAAALWGAQAAQADTIQLQGWWGGNGTVNITAAAGTVNYNDGSILGSNLTESGGAGGFKTNDLTTGGGSFLSWCIDIFHNFSFSVQSPATKQSTFNFFDTNLSAANATRITTDLDKLATNHLAEVSAQTSSPSTTLNEKSVSFQLAVWEIVNEDSGNYQLSGTGKGNFYANSAAPSDGIDPTAIARADAWLDELATTTSITYSSYVWGVSNGASGMGQQDVVVFTPVPEPEVYAMLGLGLGFVGFMSRRRKQRQGNFA